MQHMLIVSATLLQLILMMPLVLTLVMVQGPW
jgi:hypothetical protein